ncbi:M14 family zinc carboxypeptidase [Winogradskyella aquimaris]|uniref:M14 family zinc carboxypeptidase n=1 Tax=Winogradskyella aquimaris TaxID=864074 RepID=A0ABU5ESE4_9FLAO|nr:M14 family zinc carboxypeptidase [Winogradskyella aquimaris]MDY2587806.1 M14 family zinc carboxypeptidase [Winogradskyella aquimaris]
MRKITYLAAIFILILQNSFSQENHSRINILNPSQETLNLLAEEGIDLRCGVTHGENSLTLDVSAYDINMLQQLGVTYSVEIDDLETYQRVRAENDLPNAQILLNIEKSRTLAQRNAQFELRGSISETLLDNYLQYGELNEKDWLTPTEFNLGSMGGCLTLSEMEAELDDMRTYSVNNGLNIVSVKQDASSTGQTTWGNPSGTITNNGLTYTGIGGTRWNPNTIYYVRITGNESSTPEGTKPQMLFTSMIHAREVSALMNNIYFMWYIIENYNTDPAIKNLVDNNELYFVPVVNPDGLRWNQHLSATGGGMQRKNLRPGAGGTSNTSSNRGVDLNRNFDYFWGSAGTGSSGTSTSDSYRGPSAASEPETQIMVDFILSRNFKTAIWNHTFANSIPHPYGGNPSFVSGREDEMHRWHEDMTKYNRYVSGATIFTPANGIADDWMVGGSADGNGSIGSGQNILATTPEHGGEGFWPPPSSIVPIAKRSIRISLMGAYHGGKYAKFQDLTQSDISSTSANLDFAIERIGQTASNFTLTVTPISSNITNITSPSTQTGMSILEQRNVSAAITLDPSIQPNDKIEYKIQLSNDDGIFYEANLEKYYQPSVLFFHDADTDGLTGWTNSGWSNSSADAYSGSNALRTGNAVPYANNTTKTLTTSSTYNFSGSSEVLIQFYSKWDVERNFDLVEFQASTNGTTWVTLNGKYSKPKSSSNTNDHNAKGASDEAFQGNNSSGHIYDGDRMDNWVMEEVVINGSENSAIFEAPSVRFRFRMRSDSNHRFENYSANGEGFFFDDFKIIGLTIPCETSVPTNLAANTITASSADISWDNIPSATYDIRYREVGATSWIEINDLATSNYVLTGLNPLTDYEVQVRSKCTSTTSNFSPSVSFTTTDLTYCNASGSTIADEYIGGVTLNGTLNNTSSTTTSGYSDFTGSYIFEPIQIGSSGNSISISKFWTGPQYNEAVSVWIDFNRDGDFNDSGEKVFESGASQVTPVSGTFSIPIAASGGNTRMRVILTYFSTAGTIQNDPCATFQYGEVEDYDLYLYEGLLYTNSTWYPNPPSDLTGAENATILDGVFSTTNDIAVNNLTVASGSTFNVSKENTLIVNGNISNNGDFVMHSDSNEYASLLLSGSASDNLKYNRHVNSVANRNDLIAPPFSGESFIDFRTNNSNIVANTGGTLYLFGPFDKSTSDYLTYASSEVSTIVAGKGYRTASTDNGTFTFTGSATSGNLNVPIQKTGTAFEIWNLVGNPYPSYISLDDFLSANLLELDSQSAAIYGYDADNSNGSYWTILNLAYAAANPNTIIAPGQGFFVSSKDGGGTISFTPSMRRSGSSDDFIAGRNSNNAIEFGTILLSSQSKTFSTDVYFTNNATLGLDIGYDASHFDGAPADFAIYSELVNDNTGMDMAIQAISFDDVNSATIVPLGVNANQGEQVTISLNNTNTNIDIYLEDVVTNTFTLLNTSDYTFTPTSNISSIGRFYLRFGTPSLSNNESNLDVLQVYSDHSNKEIVIKGWLTSDTQVSLFDMQGRQMLNDKLETGSTINTLSTVNFSTGVYLVTISDNTSSISRKVIIK